MEEGKVVKREGIEDYFEGGDWRLGCMTLGIELAEGEKLYNRWKVAKAVEFGEGIEGQVERVMRSIQGDESLSNIALVDKVTVLEKLYKVERLSKGESTDNVSIVSKVLEGLGI
jgi:hypothetical protein